MSKNFKLVLVFLAIVSIAILNLVKPSLVERAQNNAYTNLGSYITKTSKNVQRQQINDYDGSNNQLFNSFLKERNHHLFIQEGQKWIFWSSIEINPKIEDEECDSFTRLIVSPTGYDLIFMRRLNERKFFFVSHLKNKANSTEKEKRIIPNAPYDKWTFENTTNQDHGRNYFLGEKTFLLKAVAPTNQLGVFLLLDFILLFVALCFIYSLFFKKNSIVFSLLITLLIGISVYRVFYALGVGFDGMSNFSFFSASIYASSSWLPSLGDLVLNTVFFLVLMFVIIQKDRGWLKKYAFLSWFFAGLVVFVNCLVFYYISTLLVDSQLSFNFADLPALNVYTFIGVGIVISWFVILHLLNRLTFDTWVVKPLEGLAAFLFLLLLSQLVLKDDFGFLFMGILNFTLSFLIYRVFGRFKLNQSFILEFVAFTFVFSFINYNVNIQKDKDKCKYYLSGEIIESKDKAENKILIAERAIANDSSLLQLKSYEKLTSENIIKRIQQLYFNSLPNNYDIQLYAFNNKGENILNSEDPMSREYLFTLYNNSSFTQKLNYFKPINTEGIPTSYLAKYELCGNNDLESAGSIYISMNPKSFALSSVTSTTFGNWLENDEREMDFSYAIYDPAGFLDKRKGIINYPVALPLSFVTNRDTFLKMGSLMHYVSSHPIYNQRIVVSYNLEGFGSFITNYSFFVIIVSVILIIVLVFFFLLFRLFYIFGSKRFKAKIIIYQREWFPILKIKNVLLSRKIIFSLVSIVLVALLVTLFIVLRFIQSSEKDRFASNHITKVEEVVNSIASKSFNDIVIENNRNGFLLAMARDLGKDIFLYDKDGKLFINTSTQLREGSYFAPFIPFSTLQRLKKSNTGIEVNDLPIGEINFDAYNYALLDDNMDLEGILSMPNFEPDVILNQNAANLVKTLVNLYSILALAGILLVLFIARNITKPLNLLNSRMAELKLGGSFEPLEWKGNDEISQLVSQYNSTVQQLQISTEKLAETERQGAWKEMAKQVAHEIKNPLTPMKLNLQHLQMSFSRNDDTANEKKEKIINVLLSQIDKLTRLADDFGSFARISEYNPERVNIKEALQELITLYDKEDSINIINHLTKDDLYINIDRIGFERVLNNLFKNAVQAMGHAGTINVQAKVDGKICRIAISDTGKGISPELEDKIFNPNFSTKTSGMGIGLALSKRIVENANGKIYFTSKLKAGTTFFIELPLSQNV